MIIIDYHALAVSSILSQLSPKYGGDMVLDENLGRHIILSNLLFHKRRMKKYGNVIFASDSRHYWRKDLFPYYKAKRAVKTKKAALIDWKKMHDILNKVKDEIKENMNYPFIEVDKCEADDIIFILAQDIIEKSVIISSDKDFFQLHNSTVDQYSLRHKKIVKRELDPIVELRKQIITGDRSDGIPNFLSDADTFVVPGKRQKVISSKKLDVWVHQMPEVFCETKEMYDGYKRNEALIDLSFIPDEYKEKIRAAVNINNSMKKPGTLFNYFAKAGLKNLMSDIGDF